ncbi:MAG: hypothetical protein FWF00_00610 [Endomicrobia bacterium]|nr:hypothetical protein [Endomicrobiia bacterium]MCL2506178.1 hypothetical protein [Endomicrobiia bacterium]
MKKVLFLILAMFIGFTVATAQTIGQAGTTWPKDKLPAGLLPYTDGSRIQWGNPGGELFIKISDTSTKALEAYLEQLAAKGWEISPGNYDSSAKKGVYTLEFAIQGNTWLQITLREAKVGAWPSEKDVPAALPQPHNYKLIDVYLNVNDEINNTWLFSFTAMGMTEEAATAYMQSLLKAGWDGDVYMAYTRNAKWRGKPCEISIELYGIEAGNASFTVNFGPYNN